MSSSSSDDEEDPIVKEIDVYLAKSLMDKLFLFQYPVRPASLTYDNAPHLATRMKPVQQKVEFELGLDINSPTYCFARGEQIAHVVDREDDRGKQKPFFPGHIMDRQVLSSVRATENSSKYAAALLANDALHITPVKGIIQLRPGFSYFDKAEENQKKAAAALIEAEKGESQSEDETADAKVIQPRFAKQTQTKAAKQAQLRALASKKEAEENWVDMEFYQPFDRRAHMERNLLLCYHNDFESPEFNITSKEYMKLLLPRNKEDSWAPAALPHGVLSLMKLKTLNLVDQIKTLMITAKIIQFSQLCALLGGGLDENIVIKGLTQYALLVQGCWIVKSEFLYPSGTKSQVGALDAEKIWPSRDYLMFSFNRKRALSRKEISSSTRLPTEELREVLEQLAVQRPAQGWEFKLTTDMEFLQKHQETCANQGKIWREKYSVLIKQLNLPDEFADEEWKETDFPGLFIEAHKKPSTPRRRRHSQSISEDTSDKNKPRRRSRSVSQSSQDGADDPHSSKNELKSPKKKGLPKINLTPKSPTKRRVTLDIPSDETPETNRKTEHTTKSEKSIYNNTETNSENISNDVPNHIYDEKPADVKFPPKTDKVKDSKKRTLKNKSKQELQETIDSPESDDDTPLKRVTKKPTTRKKKKKNFVLDSDKSSEEEQMIIDDEPSEIIIADSEKAENEIILEEGNDAEDSNNIEEIFVPNMPSKEKENIEKPPSDIFLKELRKFCRDSIRSGCLSLNDLKEVLHMRQQEAGNILCTGVSDELLVQCVLDTNATEVQMKWDPGCPAPISRKRVFLYRSLGEPYDKFRGAVIDMFKNSISLRRKDIFERFVNTLGDQPTNHIYSKFMSEFCENHQGQWYLGCTYQTLQKYPTVIDVSFDDESDS